MRSRLLAALVLFWGSLGVARADTITRDVNGTTSGGEPLSMRVTIDFTPTGGSFAAGTGTATARFTVINRSPVAPTQMPALGNPLITGFYFNVPPGTGLVLNEACVLAGATLTSTGVTMPGGFVGAGCHTIAADTVVTAWYALQGNASTGEYGMFSNQLTSGKGNKPALANADLFAGCVPQGYFVSPLVIGGTVRFTVALDHLGLPLSSAGGFLSQCTDDHGAHEPSSLGGKYQGTDTNALGSAYCGEPCGFTPALKASWGDLKVRYR